VCVYKPYLLTYLVLFPVRRRRCRVCRSGCQRCHHLRTGGVETSHETVTHLQPERTRLRQLRVSGADLFAQAVQNPADWSDRLLAVHDDLQREHYVV